MHANSAVLPLSTLPAPRVHIFIKSAAFIVYTFMVLSVSRSYQLFAFTILIALATLAVRLPRRSWWVPLIGLACLVTVLVWPMQGNGTWLVGLARLCDIAQLLAVFSAVSQTSEFLRLISTRLPGLRVLGYLCSTTLAVLPSIQHEWQKSRDIVWLRDGRWSLFLPWTWATILTDTLVRTVARSQRLAESVVDRNFQLRRGLTPLPYRRYVWTNVLASLLLVALGYAIVQVP